VLVPGAAAAAAAAAAGGGGGGGGVERDAVSTGAASASPDLPFMSGDATARDAETAPVDEDEVVDMLLDGACAHQLGLFGSASPQRLYSLVTAVRVHNDASFRASASLVGRELLSGRVRHRSACAAQCDARLLSVRSRSA
jgi:hypothetical protein